MIEQERKSRGLDWLYWALPPLFFLAVFKFGLLAGFHTDDFNWLQQRLNMQSWADVPRLLFTPSVHGTMRPFSERGFILFFSLIWPENPLPYRIMVFATQICAMILLSVVMRKLTGSKMAGMFAPMIWIANANLAMVMAWTSSYMYNLCSLVLLAAFYLLLRYIETGERRYYWMQWAVFIFGFGVMETDLVYPALAATYTFFFARKHLKKVLPMFLVSIAYVALHMYIAPKQHSGPYAIHIDAQLPVTLWTYWRLAFYPENLEAVARVPAWIAYLYATSLSIVLLAFAAFSALRRQWLPVWFLCWFVIVLGPVLPLREHITGYYLTIPAIGIGMLGGWALVCAWRAAWPFKAMGAAFMAGVLLISAPAAYRATHWWYDMTMEIQRMLGGVREIRKAHPGKTIVLDGVNEFTFWSSVWDGCFRAFQIENVFLTEQTMGKIGVHSEFGDVSRFFLPDSVVAAGLRRDQVVVFQMENHNREFRNVTSLYRTRLSSEDLGAPRALDAGSPVTGDLLSGQWYEADSGHRWMGKSASVKLAGPKSATEKLHIMGFCPEGLSDWKPPAITITADGKTVGSSNLDKCRTSFTLDLALPTETVGKPVVNIGVTVDRTFRVANDTRDLGLPFGAFSIR